MEITCIAKIRRKTCDMQPSISEALKKNENRFKNCRKCSFLRKLVGKYFFYAKIFETAFFAFSNQRKAKRG